MTDLNANRTHTEGSKKAFEFARKEARVILSNLNDVSLTRRALILLKVYSQISCGTMKTYRKHLWILVIFAWIFGQFLWNYALGSRYYKCLLEVPAFTQKLFRPPEDCSICRDVQQVDRISNVNPGIFEERYAYTGRPVVVTDAMANWTAPKTFSFSFFKEQYHGENGNCQFFPYKTEFRNLQDVFDMSISRSSLEKGTSPWYVGWSVNGAVTVTHYISGHGEICIVHSGDLKSFGKCREAHTHPHHPPNKLMSKYNNYGSRLKQFPRKTGARPNIASPLGADTSNDRCRVHQLFLLSSVWVRSNCDEKIGNILRQHYQTPYFLPTTAESEKTDWIFMGSHGYGAPMHVDDVEHPSWQAQIKGEKLWILEPPRECLYACERLEVVVHSGEIIVLDTNRWYHQTQIVSEDLSITIGAEYD